MPSDVRFAPHCGDATHPLDFADPLEILRSQHYAQGVMCEVLAQLSFDICRDGYEDDATAILAYISEEMLRHQADECEDLRRLLKRRAPDPAIVDKLFVTLVDRQRAGNELAQGLLPGLEAMAAGGPPPDPADFIIRALEFSERQRRLVAWEDCNLLPLSVEHLTPADRDELGRKMADRRAVAPVDQAIAV